MDEMEFTEAESNMQDLVAEYQQYVMFGVLTLHCTDSRSLLRRSEEHTSELQSQ